MAIWKIQVKQHDLTWMASRKTADQIERQTGPTGPTLGRINADDRCFVEGHAPGRLHGGVREYSISLVREPAQLVKETGIAADD